LAKKICAKTIGSSVCYGDSGGPLIVDINKAKGHKYVLVGTVSGGMPGKDCEAPGHYQRVASYKRWIDLWTKRTNRLFWQKIGRNDISDGGPGDADIDFSKCNKCGTEQRAFIGCITSQKTANNCATQTDLKACYIKMCPDEYKASLKCLEDKCDTANSEVYVGAAQTSLGDDFVMYGAAFVLCAGAFFAGKYVAEKY